MSEDRQERSDRLRQRFDRDRNEDEEDVDIDSIEEEAGDQVDTGESNDRSTTNTTASDETKNSKKSIKDRPSVLMYLPDELHTELDIRFDELNARYKREHGRSLEKNRDYYPAVVEASLEGESVEDILEV